MKKKKIIIATNSFDLIKYQWFSMSSIVKAADKSEIESFESIDASSFDLV